MIDLSFSLLATQPIPSDHGYPLYAAISRVLPELHAANGIGIHPIRGRMIGDRQMQLADFSRLTLRVPPERIANLLPLAGKSLRIAGRLLRVGVPQIYALKAATSVHSRLVTIKGFMESEPFLAALRRQLDELRVAPEAEVVIGKRRTIRIRDKEVVGYEVFLQALTAEESLSIQESGLGGRRHMGCGVFSPYSRPGHSVDVGGSMEARP